MDDSVLLESVEGLEGSPCAQSGAVWELLQSEKERICGEISGAGSLVQGNGFAANERDPSDEYIEVIDWRHREQLEHELREVVDAQDRLINGTYGRCTECGNQIDAKRLVASPSAVLCLSCQQIAEPEFAFPAI